MQDFGLLTSDTGRASSMSSFTVIAVPLLDVMLGSVIPGRTWFGALMSIAEVAMLESSGSPSCVLHEVMSRNKKNTLSFASCAKEVSTNAQANVVMSDKALVKPLQRELARLESELSSVSSGSTWDSAALLREKDLQIEKMEQEIKELILQRDPAQTRLDNMVLFNQYPKLRASLAVEDELASSL